MMPRKPKPEAKAPHLLVIENEDIDDGEGDGGERRSPGFQRPPPSEFLQYVDGSEHALWAWDVICDHLEAAGYGRDVDVIQLELLCASIARWRWCQEQYLKPGSDGRTPQGRYYRVTGRNGTQRKASPEVADEREALRVIVAIGSSFGLDPVARTRLMNGGDGGDGQESLFD